MYAWVGRVKLSFFCLNFRLLVLLITHHYHQLQKPFYFPTSSQRADDLKYHSLVSSALALILWHLKYICCLCLYQLNIFAAVSSSHNSLSTVDHNSDHQSVCGCTKPVFCTFQRTTSPMTFPPLIWAPSLKLLKKTKLPQCCAPPVETQSQRSRGSRTCFL